MRTDITFANENVEDQIMIDFMEKGVEKIDMKLMALLILILKQCHD